MLPQILFAMDKDFQHARDGPTYVSPLFVSPKRVISLVDALNPQPSTSPKNHGRHVSCKTIEWGSISRLKPIKIFSDLICVFNDPVSHSC